MFRRCKSEDNKKIISQRVTSQKNSKSEGEIMKMKIKDGMGNDEETNIE
ncbi:MAG: hypothetical protein HVN34_10005 [Methanobacteriaceae archaeon]|nr:hypothetical protein [Methanobacteriaceae archaeon]OPY20463.1 MAG: hypothetical protein A4E26_01892 [Methanobacterium sp. PtaU1.Bin097]